jgi:hypothetical protein
LGIIKLLFAFGLGGRNASDGASALDVEIVHAVGVGRAISSFVVED